MSIGHLSSQIPRKGPVSEWIAAMAPRLDASLLGPGLVDGAEWEALMLSQQRSHAQPAAKTRPVRRTFEVASPRDQDELDDAIAIEAGQGVLLCQPLEMPHISDYRLVFEVIDARERTLQAVQALLTSIAYVRRNSRALPSALAHQSRGKLARVLARLRTQTTHVVELIGLWRARRMGFLSDEGGAFAACGAARGRGSRPEPFLWFGHNYLLKTMLDLPLAPLPLRGDPLLLAWFHAPGTLGVMTPTASDRDGSGWLEWYFDARRLHGATALGRMRKAAEVLQREAAECGLASTGAPASLADDAEAALGHEMSLLLYGSRSGYVAKTRLYKRQISAAVTLQTLARRRALALRLAQRYLAARTESARMIQQRVRRMGQRGPTPTMSIASFTIAARDAHRALTAAVGAGDDPPAEDEAPGSPLSGRGSRVADESPSQSNRRPVQDSGRFSRRLAHELSRIGRPSELDGTRALGRWSEMDADRGKLEAESRETTPEPAATTRRRRRLVVLRAARLAMERMGPAAVVITSHARAHLAGRRLQQMRVAMTLGKGGSSAVVAAALKLQSAFRSRRAVMRVLADRYERILAQYASTRMAVLTSDVAPAAIRGRAALVERQRELRVEVAYLASHDGGGPTQRVESVRLRLWACEGEINALQTTNLTPRAAAKLLRDLRRKLAAAVATLSQLRMAHRPAAGVGADLPERRQLAHMRGVLTEMSLLCAQVPHASLLLLGVREMLRSKSDRLAKLLESRCIEDASCTAKVLDAMRVREVTTASMASLTDLFVDQPPAEPGSGPAPSDGAVAARVSDEERQEQARVKEHERVQLLQELAAAELDKAREAEAQVELWKVGGAIAFSVGVHTAMRRASCARLRLVCTEALGRSIVVMQAQVGLRRCQEVFEELNGAREVLADVDGMRSTMARPTLTLTVALPSERANAPSVLSRLVEDLAMWMGVPDRCFAVRSVCRTPNGGGGRPTYEANVAIFALDATADPLDLARAVLHERDRNALTPAVFATALEEAQGSVVLQSATLEVPSHAELAASAMPLPVRVAAVMAEVAAGPPPRRAAQLRGKLYAARALQDRTRWEGLRVPGDAGVVDEAWNKSAESTVQSAAGAASSGRFCALCAGRSPPVLARHRFIDCPRRLLGGLPDFTPDARASVEDAMRERALQNESACCSFRAALHGREEAKLLHKSAAAAVRFLSRYEAPIGTLTPPTDGVRVASAAARQPSHLGFDLPGLAWSVTAAIEEETRRQSRLTEPAPVTPAGGHRLIGQARWRGLNYGRCDRARPS